MLEVNANETLRFRVKVSNRSHKLGKPSLAVLNLQIDVFLGGSQIGTWLESGINFTPQAEYVKQMSLFVDEKDLYLHGASGGIQVKVKGPEGQEIAKVWEGWLIVSVSPAPPQPTPIELTPIELTSPTSSQVLGAVESAIESGSDSGSYSDIVVTDGPWGVDATVNTESIAAAAEYSGMSVEDWGSQYGFW